MGMSSVINNSFIPAEAITTASRNFTNRLRAQEESVTSILKNEGSWWGALSGDYGAISVVPEVETRGTLRGIEVTLDEVLYKALSQGTKEDPVIALDIGGGFGSTWAKLARRYEACIRDRTLLMVVSNLEGGSEILEKFARKKIGEFPRSGIGNMYSYLLQNSIDAQDKGLVNYIQMGAIDLPTKHINIGNSTVGFWRNCSVVFEHLSISHHTLAPEVDVPYIIGSVSPNGIYFLLGDDPFGGDATAPPQTFETLTAERLVRINTVETGPHKGETITSGLIIAKGRSSNLSVYA